MILLTEEVTTSTWEVLGKYAGIGGFAIGFLLIIFRSVISGGDKKIISGDQQFALLKMIITFSFIIGLLGIGIYGYCQIFPPKKSTIMTLQVHPQLIDQHGTPRDNIKVRLMNTDMNRIIRDWKKTMTGGYALFEIDTDAVQFNAILSYSNDSTVMGDTAITIRKPTDLSKNEFTIYVVDKTPVPKSFSTSSGLLRKMIEDSLHLRFTTGDADYSISINATDASYKNLVAGVFKRTGGDRISFSVNHSCEGSIKITNLPAEGSYAGNLDGYKSALRNRQEAVISSSIPAIYKKIVGCIQP